MVEMITGNPPWQGLKLFDIGMRMKADDCHPTYELPQETSELARNFLKLCFKMQRAERPSAAVLLGNDFLKH